MNRRRGGALACEKSWNKRPTPRVSWGDGPIHCPDGDLALTDDPNHPTPVIDSPAGIDRRSVLRCGAWMGAGVLWGVSGGVPYSIGLLGEAEAAAVAGPTFIQISDSH